MTQRRLMAVLALALGTSACEPIDLERMIDQPRANAYESTEVFADESVLRHPPEGTVSRGQQRGSVLLLAGRDTAGYVETIPRNIDLDALQRGRDRFEIFCAACHGVRGDGASVVAAFMQLRRPPSLHASRIREFPAGRLYQVVREGYGLMPAYAEGLPPGDAWAVVAYVQALQLSQRVPLDRLPAPIRDEAAAALGPSESVDAGADAPGNDGMDRW